MQCQESVSLHSLYVHVHGNYALYCVCIVSVYNETEGCEALGTYIYTGIKHIDVHCSNHTSLKAITSHELPVKTSSSIYTITHTCMVISSCCLAPGVH